MGYKKIPTKNLTRLEWLELRREGIGGSDASVVMGENPYRSILQLWEEKTGRKEITDEGNEHTYWGTLMEDVIRHEFMKRTGLKVRQKHFMIFPYWKKEESASIIRSIRRHWNSRMR